MWFTALCMIGDRDGRNASSRATMSLVSRLNKSLPTKMIMDLPDRMRLYGMDSAAGRNGGSPQAKSTISSSISPSLETLP